MLTRIAMLFILLAATTAVAIRSVGPIAPDVDPGTPTVELPIGVAHNAPFFEDGSTLFVYIRDAEDRIIRVEVDTAAQTLTLHVH